MQCFVGGQGLTEPMLSMRDNMAITLAAGHFKYPAARVTRARHELGWSETRFWARVDWLLDQGVAEVERPVEVRRLRRVRAARRQARSTIRPTLPAGVRHTLTAVPNVPIFPLAATE